ncbi:PREDICTED: transcription termination factor 2, mitochondrial [Nanorana parkeri]|uniref:transcription termination factor 2, mitochondrial n=1 Tax=Nanorana parkeri TaxID=125878 RepID=UPI000854FBAB|nr:PREDICTED: transcription termination factor 2, mitochondrial [Nanorana parkeri]
MLKTIASTVLRCHIGPRRTSFQCRHFHVPIMVVSRTYTASKSGTDGQNFGEENQKTVESLYNLSVNCKKIRHLKGWVLCKEEAYVEETADILKEMGANTMMVANILESCPEAFLQEPAEIKVQKSIWNLVCPKDQELITIIEKFPDSFFGYKSFKNQQDNIRYFQDLGLSNKIVCRLLTSATQIFCNQIEDNKKIIDALGENYCRLGGTKENFKTWLKKLLSQDPFVLSRSSAAFKENVTFLQNLGFTDAEVLKLMSKLKGFIFDMTCSNMKLGVLFTKTTFDCGDEELRRLVMKCPALLYYSVPLLEDRLKHLIQEGASISQVKEYPNILELTPQIIQFRARKVKALGRQIKDQDLEVLNGTKKDFEANYVKLQVRRERPLFNPVAPLNVEE